MAKTTVCAVRGMNDLLPNSSKKYSDLQKIISDILQSYGYEFIRTPLVEKTNTFHNAIGEGTDVVSKEMYSWVDGKENLSLRPEGTAGVVRAMVEHNLPREGVQKVFYHGAMFRHERPQKGRYREFHQIGAEVFGIDCAKIDAELIAITQNIWQKLNIKAELQINSLGSNQCREKYKNQLVEYFTQHIGNLDKDSLSRLKTNPLRILDSKNPDMLTIISNAPKLLNNLDAESQNHFDKLLNYLDNLSIKYTINPTLVRGLDYYNATVFEWVSYELGSQGTICAGGRYDNLVEKMGGKPTSAIGFAIGMERLNLLLTQELSVSEISVYLIANGAASQQKSLTIAELIHQYFPKLILYNDCSNASFKSQFKKADKKQADYAIIIGDEEVENGIINVKPLKTKAEQKIIKDSEITQFFAQIL